MHCSDALLRRMYLRLNRRYWGGELPLDCQVLWMPLSADRVAETAELPGGKMVIRISPAISGFRAYWRLALIHEMCHVRLWPRRVAHHGRVWQEEMMRVLSLGASRWL